MAKTSAILPNARSEQLLKRAVERSKRTRGVQLPISFLRSSNSGGPPLARMIRGGHGGEVRLKLYLSLSLLATGAPYDIRSPIPARTWAEMLALPSPDTSGARRIADGLNWLQENKLIKLGRQAGMPPTIRLLNAAGDGTKYVRPGAPRWVSVPLGLWWEQWITTLSGSGLALLLILLELQGGKKSPSQAPWASRERRDEYNLSDDTWTRASKELTELDLLTVRRVPYGKEDFAWQRMRNTYWISRERLELLPRALVPEYEREALRILREALAPSSPEVWPFDEPPF